MKIPCVRCGKKIDSPNVYCKECQKDMGIAIGTPPRSKRRWYTYLLFLLVLIVAGYYVYAGSGDIVSKIASLAGDVEQTAEELKQTVFDQLHIEESGETVQEPASDNASVASETAAPQLAEEPPTADVPSADQAAASDFSDSPDTPAASPQPADAAEKPEQAVASEPDASVQGEKAPEATPTQETAVEQPVEAAAAATASVSDAEAAAPEESVAAAADASVQPAAKDSNALLQVKILVYYLKNKDADVKVQKQLQDAGYTNVEVKGKWPGAFNDQNVFYRTEGQPGVKEILSVLGSKWFDYYYNGERISRSVKQIFNEDDAIQFLIIPK